jgi:polynucleotide 5'-kinase involved in rRNA processing
MEPVLPPAPPSEVLAAWQDLVGSLPPTGRLVVFGASDSGKTTLAWWLAEQLRSGGRCSVALVDADVGQSRIGPPTTVGWWQLGTDRSGFYFVGATAPDRRPAGMMKATLAACRAGAEAGSDWVVLDTTGCVSGPVGPVLKSSKIKHLRPVHVVLLGELTELEASLESWRDDPEVSFHRLAVTPAVKSKSGATRKAWRENLFARWLSGANLRWVEKQDRDWLHAPAPELWAADPGLAERLKGLLLGFCDGEGRGQCVGLLQAIDWRAGRILVLGPPQVEEAAMVDFGCLRLKPDGTQF